MKFFLLIAILSTFVITESAAQAPELLTYQTVVRDPSGALARNTAGILRLSVLQGGPSGTAIYSETQIIQLDGNGLLQTALGSGTVILGQLDTIDWSEGPYFLKVEVGPEGASEYSEAGVTQLLSVPYVLYSNLTGHVPVSVSGSGDTVYIGKGYVIAKGASAANAKVVSPPVLAVYPSGYVHCLSGGSDTTDIIDVTNPLTGKTWMDRNLGASQAATAYNDVNSYGDLFQWGRFADGHQCRNSGTTGTLASSSTPGNNLFVTVANPGFNWLNISYENLWQGLFGVNNPCPDGYRIPTETEWQIEKNSFGSNNSRGAFESPLKLPVSGARDLSSGDPVAVGVIGFYWSSTVSGTTVRTLDIGATANSVLSNFRAFGASVRCIKDVSPPSYPADFVHCFDNGDTTDIVEVTNPLTGKTWMDRNLGASQVAVSKTDSSSYGDLFQWGRFADGHQCRDSDTLTVQASSAFSYADSAWYGKFIKAPGSPYSWLETPDAYLWQGTRSLNNPCPKGYRLPSDAEWNQERESWSENTSTGAFNSPLKLPVSGYRRDSDGKLIGAGSIGYYWSGTVSSSTGGYLNFIVSNASVGTNFLANGVSVRCLKN